MDQAAERLGISLRTLFRLVAKGTGPQRIRIGRRAFIADRDLDLFIEHSAEKPREA